MNTITWRRRLAAALLLPFLLVLAGCGRLHADFEINDVDSIDLTLDFAVDSTYIESEYSSAEEMCSDMQTQEDTFGEVTPEPYEEDGMWGCRAAGVLERQDFGSGFELTEENGEYHLVMGSDATGTEGGDMSMLESQVDFRVTFAFPGDVIESKGGTIDGNTVTYTSITEFSEGVDITAEADGFPWLIVVLVVALLGLLLLAALAVGAFLFLRSRKKGSTPASTPGGYGSSAGRSPSVPPAPGAAAVPPAPQGSHQWNGSAAQSPPAQGQWQGQGQQGYGQQAPGQQSGAPYGQGQQGHGQQGGGQQWNQPPQGSQGQPWNQQPPQNPGW